MKSISPSSLIYRIIISISICLFSFSPLLSKPVDSSDLSFPSELGSIEYISSGNQDRTIIHIQDAHCYYQVQQQIIKIIAYFKEKENITHIFIEGADNRLNADSISSFPDDKINLTVADYFLKEGKISGVEYLLATGDRSINAIGVEQRELYRKNYELFSEAQSLADDITAITTQLQTRLNEIKRNIFSPELLALEQNESAYFEGEDTLRHYLQYLIQTAQRHNLPYRHHIHLIQLLDLIDMEKKLNRYDIERQKNELIALLQAKLSDDQKIKLLDATLSYSLQKLDSQSMFRLLAQFAKEIGEPLDQFESLAQYITYLESSSLIDISAVDSETYMLTGEIKNILCESDLQRDTVRSDRFLRNLTKLIKLSLSSEDIEQYHSDYGNFLAIISEIAYNTSGTRNPEFLINQAKRLLDLSRCFESFYDVALKRDVALVQNTIDAMQNDNISKAILISGGFHAKGICSLFAQHGFNVVTIKPRLLDVSDTPSQYTSNILGKRNALEQYLLLKWNTLAVAASLTEGSPLVQEWKGGVYRTEMNIMQMVLKLTAIRTGLQLKLGISTAEQITDAIASTLASQLADESQNFLSLWNEQHKSLTGMPHPVTESISVKVNIFKNDVFATITLNGEDITFPINNRFNINPGAIINAYLTPERFAAIIAGKADIRESITTVEQLRDMRKKVNALLVRSESISERMTDEETLLLSTIIKSVMTSQSPLAVNAAKQLTDESAFAELAGTVNKAIFDRQLEQLSTLLSTRLSYERLTQLTRFGAAAPLHVFMKELKNVDPALSDFSEYLIDNFNLFAPTDSRETIVNTILALHERYLADDITGTHQSIDRLTIDRLAKIIHASLKFGDAIRPHGIASILAYGLHPFDDAAFNQINEIHDLLEQESIYSTNEVIMMLFYSHWTNPDSVREIIKTPLSFQRMISLMNSEEWKAMRINPTPYTFGKFVRRYAHMLSQPVMLQLFSCTLPAHSPLRESLSALSKEGWSSQNETVTQFTSIATQLKLSNGLTGQDSATYDMIIFTLQGRILPELSKAKPTLGTVVASFDQIDPMSDIYDESLSDVFFNRAKISKGINIFAADLDFPFQTESTVTDSDITITRDRYRQIVGSLIKKSETPTLLFVDKNFLKETQNWILQLNPASIIILLPYDFSERDLALTGKKRLSFIGYRMNLIDQLRPNFNNRLNLLGLPKDIFSWFDDYSRDVISIDRALVLGGQPTQDEYKLLAKQPDREIISALLNSDSIDQETLELLIANPAFRDTHTSQLMQNTDIHLNRSTISAIAEKLTRQDIEKIFSSVQNMRTAMILSMFAEKHPQKAQWVISDMEPAQLATIIALAQKLGFNFSEHILPKDFTHSRWVSIIERLSAISPHISANLLFVLYSKNTDAAIQAFNSMAGNIDNSDSVQTIANDLIKLYANEHPDFIELIPFINSDITPAWHKAFVLSHALELLYSGKPIQPYIYSILTVFSEDSSFSEWVQSNIKNHPDRVNDWLQIVSLFPDSNELRATQLLTSAIKTDKHILTSYKEFVIKVASQKEPYKHLRDDIQTFNLIFSAVNSTFAQPIENKMFVFHIVPYISEFIPEGMSMKDIFDRFTEKTDAQGALSEPGIPVYAILPALIIAENDLGLLESIKQLFSAPFIRGSNSTKQRIASNFLHLFANIDQANIYGLIPSRSFNNDLFIETLKLQTTTERREEIFASLIDNRQLYRGMLKRFEIASRKQDIIRKITHFTSTKFTKKDQKLFADILDFLLILTDNYHILEQDENKSNLALDNLIDSINRYPNVRAFHTEVMKLFARFIQLDFPDAFESEEDILAKLPRIEQVTNYWLYRTDLQEETPQGINLLRKAVEGYLKEGLSLKHIKYGGTPETKTQLAIYEAILTQTIQEELLTKDPSLTDSQALAKAQAEAKIYSSTWQRDMTDRIDLSAHPELKHKETIVAWTSDDVPDWLRFGLSGGGTCLAPGNVSSYTKNLPGYIFSAMVTGGLYLGKYKGDIRDRVNQALVPANIDRTIRMYIVNQFYYSSGGQIAHDIGIASVIAAIRNAAQFGASGVIIPTGSPQASYVSQMQDFLKHDFSTVIERRDSSGKLVARERVTVKAMEHQTVNLIVAREPNPFRYFDAAKGYTGKYFEKLDPNFSFVDFSESVPHEIAGVRFDGIEVETPSIVLIIEKETLSVESAKYITETPVELSEALKDMMAHGRLAVLSEIKPELRERFDTLVATERTTGKYLNQLLFLSEQLSQEVELRYVDRTSEHKHIVVSISQRGLPVARKLTNMLDDIDYITVEIDTTKNTVLGADQIEPTERGTVFIVDEGIMTGSTAVKNIETILQNNIALPEEIVFVTLTADPSAVERLMRKYPDIRVVVGTFETRVEKDGEVISPLMNMLTDKAQQIDLSAQTKVKVGGVEYKLLDRVQRGDSFVAYLAESPSGEHVFLKTTVSKDEGERLSHIWDLVERQTVPLGVPKVHQYDEETGVLVLSQISGPTLLEYIRQSDKTPAELLLDIMDALNDVIDVARFLSSQGALYVNITRNNLRIDPASGKWFITNYSPFPYRIQPLSESGVLQQLEWVITEITGQFRNKINENDEIEFSLLNRLLSLVDDMQNERISTIDQLEEARSRITHTLLSVPDLNRVFNFQGEDLNSFYNIISDNQHGYATLEKLHTILRSGKYHPDIIRGTLKLLLQTEKIDVIFKQQYFTEHFDTLLDEINTVTHSNKTATFMYMQNHKDFFDKLASHEPLNEQDLSQLATETQVIKSMFSPYLSLAKQSIDEGKPIVLAGNLESIKWILNMLYQELGDHAVSSVFILPELSTAPVMHPLPGKLLAKTIIAADNLVFHRKVTKASNTLLFNEASLLEWLDITPLKLTDSDGMSADNLNLADHVRLRMVHNPRLNIYIQDTYGHRVGLLSSTAMSIPDINIVRSFPSTQDNANALFYYSLAVGRSYQQAPWFQDMLMEIEYQLGLKLQYAESFMNVYPSSLLSDLITKKYIPQVLKNTEIVAVIEKINADGNTSHLEALFPNSPESFKPYIKTAISSLWPDTASFFYTLSAIGEQHFAATAIANIIERIVADNPVLSVNTGIYSTITAMLGVRATPLAYISASTRMSMEQQADMEKAYHNYSHLIKSNLPLINPLSLEQFRQLAELPEGTEAFDLWLDHHYPSFVDTWNQTKQQDGLSFSTSFLEEFGSALLLFVNASGRNLLDQNTGQMLYQTEGILFEISESGWLDPFNTSDTINGMGISMALRIPYLIGSEEDYLFTWFNETTARGLRELLELTPQQLKEQIIIRLINMNMETRYESYDDFTSTIFTRYEAIELMMNAILESPVSNQRKIELLLSSVDSTGVNLMADYGYENKFYILDANEPLPTEFIELHLHENNAFFVLIGDYNKVTASYNELSRLAGLLDSSDRIRLNKRIIGLRNMISNIPDNLLKTSGQIYQFALQDDAIAVEKLAGLPLLAFPETQAVSMASSETINQDILAMMGAGGVLSRIAQAHNISLQDITKITVTPLESIESTIFLKISVTTIKDQFDVFARLTLHDQLNWNDAIMQMQRREMDTISDQVMHPVNLLTRLTVKLPEQYTFEVAFYSTLPNEFKPLANPLNAITDKAQQITSDERLILRQTVERITRLYLKYGVIPETNAPVFLFDETRKRSDIYLITDAIYMRPIVNDEHFMFSLLKQADPQIIPDIFKGILDALEGNITAFQNFTAVITRTDFGKFASDSIIRFANNHLNKNIDSSDQRQEILRHISAIVLSNFDKTVPIDITPAFASLIQTDDLRESIDAIMLYTNQLHTAIQSAQNTVEQFAVRYNDIYLPATAEFYLNQLRALQISEIKADRLISQKDTQNFMDSIRSSNTLSPSQLILAKTALSRQRFVAQIQLPDGTYIPNPGYDQNILESLDKLIFMIRTDPADILNHLKSLSQNTGLPEPVFLSLVLPQFDVKNRSATFGQIKLRISQLPLLLRAENIFLSKPIALVGNSSSLNFQMFAAIQSLFNLSHLSANQLFDRVYGKYTTDTAKHSEQAKTELIRTILSTQNRSFTIDLAQKDNNLLIKEYSPSITFDMRHIDDFESFLQQFTFIFDSDDTQRISAQMDNGLLTEYFPAASTKEHAINELLQNSIKLRILLRQALSGQDADLQAYFAYAKTLGIGHQAQQLLLQEQMRVPSYAISARIADAIAKSGSMPQIADLIDSVKQNGIVDETKFMIFIDVYSSLAIEYFAKKIADLTTASDVHIDVDMGMIKIASDRLIDLGEDHSFVLDMLADAKIQFKTFEKGTPVEKIIQFTNQIKSTYPLFAYNAFEQIGINPNLGLAIEEDVIPDPLRYRLPNRQRAVIESSL